MVLAFLPAVKANSRGAFTGLASLTSTIVFKGLTYIEALL